MFTYIILLITLLNAKGSNLAKGTSPLYFLDTHTSHPELFEIFCKLLVAVHEKTESIKNPVYECTSGIELCRNLLARFRDVKDLIIDYETEYLTIKRAEYD
jgi:hypothetical protein